MNWNWSDFDSAKTNLGGVCLCVCAHVGLSRMSNSYYNSPSFGVPKRSLSATPLPTQIVFCSIIFMARCLPLQVLSQFYSVKIVLLKFSLNLNYLATCLYVECTGLANISKVLRSNYFFNSVYFGSLKTMELPQGSEQRTNLVFKWSKTVCSLYGPFFKQCLGIVN